MITKTFYSLIAVLAVLNKLLLVILVFYLFSFSAIAQEFDKNANSENEKKAIELGKVWKLESIKQSVNLFEQSAKHWENLNEPQRAVFCLNEAAKLSQSYSDFETSFRVLNNAIEIEKKSGLVEEEIISSSLFAFFSNENNDSINSQRFSRAALLLSEKTSSAKAKAYSNFCSGMYQYYYGRMNAATKFFIRSADYAQQTQDIFIISQSLFYVGFAYIREGYSYRAVEKMALALHLCKSFNYAKGEALSYFGLAASYYFTEKQKALNFLLKAELLFTTDCEWMEKARIATTIGNLYMDLGEFDLAESYFHKAIPNHEKANYTLGKITALTLLADTYLLKADLKEAKETYELALSLTTITNDKFRAAVIKEGLGNLELQKNNFDSAIRNYQEALFQYNEIGVKLPSIENLLGKTYRLKGNNKKAREFFNSALQTNRRTKDLLQLSETLFNFANLHVDENNIGEAFANITESIELTEHLYSDVVNSKLKSSYFSSVLDRYELYISLLMTNHSQLREEDYANEALKAAEKSRARAMLENLSLSEADFFKDADAETVRREKEIRILLNAKADSLTDLLSQNADETETEKISNEINELEHELEDTKAKLKQSSPIYSSIKNPEPFDVAEFQKNVLDNDSLLLEFSFGNEESYLWLVAKNELSSFVLPPRREIEKHIENLRELLKDRESRTGESIEDLQARINQSDIRYKTEVSELSNKLLGPVADKLGNKRLIIVPDGKLRYFPIAALPLPNSDSDEPILVTNETIYEPSAQALTFFSKTKTQKPDHMKDLVIFSDPVFSGDDSRFSSEINLAENLIKEESKIEQFRFMESLNDLQRLSGSEIEGEAIGNILGRSATDSFSGFSATRENALSPNMSNYSVIHFATHGLVNEERPELSGIVLSGYNESGQKQEQVVRLQDIYGMNLNADLVVLSACETGIGKDVKGEGLQSLNNAFLSVGARSVVSTLWKVEDSATLELMKNFYGSMANGNTTTSNALRDAQLKMLKDPRYKSPFYWAAFTIQGDFQRVANISSASYFASKTVVGIILFAFAAMVLGFLLLRKRPA